MMKGGTRMQTNIWGVVMIKVNTFNEESAAFLVFLCNIHGYGCRGVGSSVIIDSDDENFVDKHFMGELDSALEPVTEWDTYYYNP